VDNDSGAEEATINGDEINGNSHTPTQMSNGNGTRLTGGRIAELLKEEREGATTPEPLGNSTNRYKATEDLDVTSEDGSLDALPRRAASPIDSMLSIPDDSPSVQVGSQHNPSSCTNVYLGLNSLLSRWQQHITFCCLEAWPRKSYPILPTFRQTLPVPSLEPKPLSTPRFLPSIPQSPLSYSFSKQSATTRSWRYRYLISTMGSCTMDEAEEDERSSVF